MLVGGEQTVVRSPPHAMMILSLELDQLEAEAGPEVHLVDALGPGDPRIRVEVDVLVELESTVDAGHDAGHEVITLDRLRASRVADFDAEHAADRPLARGASAAVDVDQALEPVMRTVARLAFAVDVHTVDGRGLATGLGELDAAVGTNLERVEPAGLPLSGVVPGTVLVTRTDEGVVELELEFVVDVAGVLEVEDVVRATESALTGLMLLARANATRERPVSLHWIRDVEDGDLETAAEREHVALELAGLVPRRLLLEVEAKLEGRLAMPLQLSKTHADAAVLEDAARAVLAPVMDRLRDAGTSQRLEEEHVDAVAGLGRVLSAVVVVADGRPHLRDVRGRVEGLVLVADDDRVEADRSVRLVQIDLVRERGRGGEAEAEEDRDHQRGDRGAHVAHGQPLSCGWLGDPSGGHSLAEDVPP